MERLQADYEHKMVEIFGEKSVNKQTDLSLKFDRKNKRFLKGLDENETNKSW